MTNPENDQTRNLCWAYFRNQMDRIHSGSAQNGGIVMPMLCYGSEYLMRFAAFTMPSLMSIANIKALAGRTRLLVYTDEASRMALWDVTQPLHQAGIDVQVVVLPPAMLEPHLKYMTLGTVHHIGLHAAQHWRAAIHMIAPDHVYSRSFFPNLSRLGHEHQAVGHVPISADIVAARPALERARDPSGILTLTSETLGAIAWQHMHPIMGVLIANDMDAPAHVPPVTPHIWKGQKAAILYSWHQNVDYLSPFLVSAVPPPRLHTVFATLDTRWPYITTQYPYAPTLEDDMVLLELSGAEKVPQQSPVSLFDFAVTSWHICRFTNDYITHFSRPTMVPIGDQPDGLPDDVIAQRQAEIIKRTIELRPEIAVKSIQFNAKKVGWRTMDE